MPNWCSCDLIIKGPKNIREHFEAYAKDPENKNKLLDMAQFVPYPETFKQKDIAAKEDPALKDGYNDGGYYWCLQHWGTKWNFGPETELKKTKTAHIYTFDTAWSPPTPVIFAMSERYPHLTFTLKYYEQGCGFSGSMELKNASIIKQSTNNDYKGGRGG